MEIQGDYIVRFDPHTGFLHRAMEKLMEYKTFNKGLPYMDRLDYVSIMSQEHVFSLAVESLKGVDILIRGYMLRTLWSEITRHLNHLLAICCHGGDCGALTLLL